MTPSVSPAPEIQVSATTPLGKLHARRLRDIYRSAGWPCRDTLEIELLAGGMLDRVASLSGHETLRVTDAGLAWLSVTLARNRAALSAHEALVDQVACEMVRAGRVSWRGLALRAQLPPEPEGRAARWCMVRPDVFSIRNTSVAAYVEPIVHEIKVSRADLLGDLRRPEKRAAYLDLGGECWYVLGNDARGRSIASPDEVPAECGVMVLDAGRLSVARAAPRRQRQDLPFHVWMALAKATPVKGLEDDLQHLLSDACGETAADDSAPLD